MERKEINTQDLTKEDRLSLAMLLIKAGYSVRLARKVAPSGKTYIHVVEYWTEERKAT